jgi:hypothetical protein
MGLLPEPERRPNGYREYGLRDAIVLARIRRLTELGLSLDEVQDVLADDQGRDLRESCENWTATWPPRRNRSGTAEPSLRCSSNAPGTLTTLTTPSKSGRRPASGRGSGAAGRTSVPMTSRWPTPATCCRC